MVSSLTRAGRASAVRRPSKCAMWPCACLHGSTTATSAASRQSRCLWQCLGTLRGLLRRESGACSSSYTKEMASAGVPAASLGECDGGFTTVASACFLRASPRFPIGGLLLSLLRSPIWNVGTPGTTGAGWQAKSWEQCPILTNKTCLRLDLGIHVLKVFWRYGP